MEYIITNYETKADSADRAIQTHLMGSSYARTVCARSAFKPTFQIVLVDGSDKSVCSLLNSTAPKFLKSTNFIVSPLFLTSPVYLVYSVNGGGF